MILKVTIFDQIYVHEFNVILEKLENGYCQTYIHTMSKSKTHFSVKQQMVLGVANGFIRRVTGLINGKVRFGRA